MIRNEESKQSFKCGICGNAYLTASARNICETACLKKAEEKAKVLKNAEKEKKRREIQSRIDELKQLVDSYNITFMENLKVNVEVKSIGSGYCFNHVSESMDTKTITEMINEALLKARFNE